MVAQLVEHLTFNQRVPGSSPGQVTNKKAQQQSWAFLIENKTWREVYPEHSRGKSRPGHKEKSSATKQGFFTIYP